jgi:hypothetical protein
MSRSLRTRNEMSDLGLSASVAVAAVLVMAAVPKLRDGKAFHLIVREFGVVPARLTVPVARALPIAEVLLAAGLIVPLLRRGSAIAAAILIGIFTIATLIALRSSSGVPCGCFGMDRTTTVSRLSLVRNGLCFVSPSRARQYPAVSDSPSLP